MGLTVSKIVAMVVPLFRFVVGAGAPKVWVPFMLTDDYHRYVFVGRVFSSREKATKAYPNAPNANYTYAPYRIHGAGSGSVVYIYIRDDDNVTITNIADDLEDLAKALPGCFSVVQPFDVRRFAYALE
jgi:hypothetical protein